MAHHLYNANTEQTAQMSRLIYLCTLRYEQKHDKTYNKTCVTSKDSYQPVYPPSTARVLVYPSSDSQDAVKDICDQRIL